MRASLCCISLWVFGLSVPAWALGEWSSPPPDSALLILATGADTGYVHPRGCFKGNGGMLYRPAFEQWLGRNEAAFERIWLSAGNVLSHPETRDGAPAREVLDALIKTPYTAVAVGTFELEALGTGLVGLARELPFPLLATNLRIHETGKPALAEWVVRETAAGKIGILAVLPHQPSSLWADTTTGTIVTVPPGPAVADAIRRLRPSVDVLVLLSSLPYGDLRAELAGWRGIDIVLASWSSYTQDEVERHWGPPVLWLGYAGQYLGRVAITRSHEIQDISLVPVLDDFPIDPTTGQPTNERTSRQ